MTDVLLLLLLSIKGACVQANSRLAWPNAEPDQRMVGELQGDAEDTGWVQRCCARAPVALACTFPPNVSMRLGKEGDLEKMTMVGLRHV